jgi:uncharacterized small protein (DUF1192 family)
MLKDDDELLPLSTHRPVADLQLGQALDDMSLEELGARIALLRHEIERLEEARQAKEASRAVAAAFFKI